MRKLLSLLLFTAATMFVGTAYAADPDESLYNAAIAAISDGTYRISTTVDGTKYYITSTGKLTSTKSNACIFDITKASGGALYNIGLKISTGSQTFTNAGISNSKAVLNCSNFALSTNDRDTWERQVPFLKDGKYAIRACNTAYGETSWADCGRVFFSYTIADAVVSPQYSYDPQFIWDFELVATINVTYELYESDGTTLVKSNKVKAETYSEPNPESVTGISYNGSWHEMFYYNYTTEGTIADADCTIKVIRTWDEGTVKALADLSNTKVYNIGCDRGALLTKDGTIGSTSKTDLATADFGEFAIINYEDNYYIYSVADKMFVSNTGALTEMPYNGTYDAIQMALQTSPYFLYTFKINDTTTYGVNTNGTGALNGCVINNWTTPDPGDQYYMVAIADFDPAEALSALQDYFHPTYFITYVVKDEAGQTLFTSEKVPTRLGKNITTLPAEYQRSYYTYNNVDVTIADEETTIEFTATWNGPFEISADFASAHWYDMAMRSNWYVTTDNANADGSYNSVEANAIGLVKDSYLWAFVGNGYNGFKVLNKAAGDGKSFGWTDANATNAGIPSVMADSEGNHAWNIVPSTDTSVPTGSFCLNVPGTNLYINQYGGAGGSLKFWNSANNIGDPGSAFTVFDVPTNFAEFTADIEAALTSTATGYFTIKDEVKALWNEAYKTDCTYEKYAELHEAINNLDSYVLPETGYYTLKNKYYGTYMGIDPSDANMYGNYNAANQPKNIVKLTKNGTTYSISLMGKYAPAAAKSTQVTATTTEVAYNVTIPTLGYAAFAVNPADQYTFLHRNADGNIVGWEATADASQWTVEDATSVEFTIGKAGYATAYLPFPVSFNNPVTVPTPKGEWTFDDADNLMAGTGVSTLAAATHTNGSVTVSTPVDANITATAGPAEGNGAVTVPVGSSLQLTNNLGVDILDTYSFMMDIKLADVSGYSSLLNTHETNYDDGDLFIKDGKIGTSGIYDSTIATDTWYRVIFVSKNRIPTVYVNGAYVTTYPEGTNTSHYYTRWAMNPTALFFADENGEEKEVVTSEICFWDEALSEEQIAALGVAGTELPQGGTVAAYTGKIVDKWLALSEVLGAVPELTPVVVKGNPGTYTFNVIEGTAEGLKVIDDGTIDGPDALAKETAVVGENDLKGTLEPMAAGGSIYVLAQPEGEEVGFYQTSGGTVAAGKAYLEIDASSGIKGFTFKFGEDPTGIANVNGNVNESDVIYNLAGQRLGKIQKGINIVNGKKILY